MYSSLFLSLLGILFGIIITIHGTIVSTVYKTTYNSDSVYSNILEQTGTAVNITDCGSGKIFELEKLKYGTGEVVSVFIPENNISFDNWISITDLNACNSSLKNNGINYTMIETDGIYIKGNNENFYLGKNSVKSDNTISF